MEFKEIVDYFAQAVGVPELAADENGVCSVDVDGMTLVMSEQKESRQLIVWSELGEMPAEGRDQLFQVLLQAMYMGIATEGAVFAIDPETKNLVMYRQEPLQFMEGSSFMAMFEGFVNVLERWRNLLADFRPVLGEVEQTAKREQEDLREFRASGFLQV